MSIVRRLMVALAVATLAAAITAFLAIQWDGCKYVFEGPPGIEGGQSGLVRVCHLTPEGMVSMLGVFSVTATAVWLYLRARANASHVDQAGLIASVVSIKVETTQSLRITSTLRGQ